jgi:glycosyltransferase involved in cell wall biosynthesis
MREFGWSYDLLSVLHPGDDVSAFESFECDPFMTREGMAERIRASHAEVIHVHNEPNWPVSVAKSAAGNRSIIFDVHDITSARADGVLDPDEARAYEDADAFIFCTSEQRDFAIAAGFAVKDKPWIAVPNASLARSFIQESPLERIGGVVYEGYTYRRGDSRVWRDMSGLSDALDGALHIYSPFEPDYGHYHGCLEYDALIVACSQYDWGLIGVERGDVPGLSHSSPTKMFDYLAAGIPFIAFNVDAARELCAKGMGVTCETREQLRAAAMLDPTPYRAAVLAHRHEYAMERYAEPLARFFEARLNDKAQS